MRTTDPVAALGALVGDVDDFLGTYWEREPMHRVAALDATVLFSVDAVDELIASSALLWPIQIRLAKDGEILDPRSFTAAPHAPGLIDPPLVADPAGVVEQYLDGASILVQGLQRIWPPITELCGNLDAALSHTTTVTAFLTPPTATGLPRHADPYDVFVIQVTGTKRWALHAPDPESPPNGGVDRCTERDGTDIRVDVGPGDVLYIPQGWFHSAVSLDDVSLHVSVMINKRRWSDVIEQVVAQLVTEPEFRETLPAQYALDPARFREELRRRMCDAASWLQSRDVHALADDVVREFWEGRRPSRRGQLTQTMAVAGIDDETLIRGRGGASLRVFEDRGSATVVLGQSHMTVPAPFAAVLHRLEGGGALVVGELAGLVDDELRLPLVRQLVRQGYCEILPRATDGR